MWACPLFIEERWSRAAPGTKTPRHARQSLSVMVTVAVEVAPSVPPVGALSTTRKVSTGSATVLLVMVTLMTIDVTPGAKLSVPDRAGALVCVEARQLDRVIGQQRQ